MKKSFLFVGALLLGIAGCRSGYETLEKQNAELKQRNAEILAELRKLDTRLSALEKRLSPPRRRFVVKRADPAKIKNIKPLPPNPSDAQILAYIREIAVATAGQNSFSPNDPQVALYRKIGPGHLELLLPFLGNGSTSFHLRYALPALVNAADIPLIRKNLPSTPALLSAVATVEFGKPMKREIFQALRSPSPFISPRLQKIIAGLAETPEDLKSLEEFYVDNHNSHYMTEVLVRVPGGDLKRLTVRAWQAARNRGESGYTLNLRAMAAVRHGHDVGACKYLLETLAASQPRNWQSGEAERLLESLSDFPVRDRSRLAEWYGKNRDRIVFDEKSGKFVVTKK